MGGRGGGAAKEGAIAVVAEILAGLPPYGELAVPFPADGLAAHREGVVVRISDGGTSWVGNFQPGLSRFSKVELLPDQRHLLVVSGGAGYVVDPRTRALMSEVGTAIVGILRYEPANLLILNHQGISFEAIGPAGVVWKTERISWDSFRDLHIAGERILGEAWQPFSPQWIAFSVDIHSGEVSGGAEFPPGAR